MAKSTPRRPAKTHSMMAAARATQHLQTRFNPIKGLDPRRLVTFLDAWDHGYLRNFALLAEKIGERDDQVITCRTKRLRAPARLNWDILPMDDSAEAAADAEALREFYNSIEVTHALDLDMRGGVRLLVQQILECQANRYAVHEIIWRPQPAGLSAEFRFVPLYFFERITGRLRFLSSDLALTGEELEPGGWMVATGDGLMIPTAVAYMFKSLPLKSWVRFCEKFGIPGLHGETNAPKDSPEWEAMKEALARFGEDLALLTNLGAKITPIQVSNAGNSPFQPLVDRMDRAISRIWLGGDLATMSQDGQAVGSNAQTGDLENLEEDDALLATEVLQHYVDPWVIRYRFGREPKAYFKLLPRPRLAGIDRDIKRIETGAKYGIAISQQFVRETLALPEPAEDDELIQEPSQPNPDAQARGIPFANDAARTQARSVRAELFRAQALRDIALAKSEALRPLRDRLVEILGMDDDTQFDAALLKLQNDAPQILRDRAATPEEVEAWMNLFAAGLASGAIEAAEDTPPRAYTHDQLSGAARAANPIR